MDLTVREINLENKKELNEFIDLPWALYKNDPYWVPQLKMALRDLLNVKKHPFYQTAKVSAFMAYKEKRPVGRIMAINNHAYNKFQNSTMGFFGFYEAIDDLAVSELLFKTAEKNLKDQGLSSMQGPMNPGTNYECGLLVDSFNDSPQIMMTYNPSYYPSHFENFGLIKAMDLLAYNFKLSNSLPQIILDIAARTEKKSNVSYRSLNLKNWTEELDIMFEIYNSAWEANWGFVPMTKDEFYHTAKDLKSIVDPSLVQFALVNGQEAGFILALPDLNQVFKQIPSGNLSPMAIYKIMTAKKRMNRARVITMGIKKEYRKLGLETLLYRNLQASLQKRPELLETEMSWILETNLEMNKPLIRMGGEAYKRYRLYEKGIG